jgi:hypothetical protein
VRETGKENPWPNMEHAHYVVLFAGLIFRNNPAANHRSGVARGEPHDLRSIERASTKVERSSAKLFAVLLFLAWGKRMKHIFGGCPDEMAPPIRA